MATSHRHELGAKVWLYSDRRGYRLSAVVTAALVRVHCRTREEVEWTRPEPGSWPAGAEFSFVADSQQELTFRIRYPLSRLAPSGWSSPQQSVECDVTNAEPMYELAELLDLPSDAPPQVGETLGIVYEQVVLPYDKN
jgi:hypothetical protein